MDKERILKDVDMCIAGIERDAKDTIWVHDVDFPERPQTVVECLHKIRDALETAEALKPPHNIHYV